MTEQEIALKAAMMDTEDWDFVNRVLLKRRITSNGCWEFTGKINDGGYGVAKHKGVRVTVHRMFYKLLKPSEFKENLLACHSCNNRLCFNLAEGHVYMGTALDNHKDSVEAGTMKLIPNIGVLITHCVHGHEYTVENTMINATSGGRQCRLCYVEYQKQYRAKQAVIKLMASILKKK